MADTARPRKVYAKSAEKKMENKIATPTLDKLREVREQSQIIGEFLDYMSQRGYEMCELVGDDYMPTRKTIEGMLALFFEIDLVKAEDERRALLEQVRQK